MTVQAAHNHPLSNTSPAVSRRVTSLLTLALLAAGACDLSEPEAALADELAEADEWPGAAAGVEVAPSPRAQAVLVLGSGSAIIDGLADELALIPADDLESSERYEILSESRALAVDLSTSTADEVAQWKPMFDEAWRSRTPVVFTNVEDSSAMAAAIGFGLEGEVVVAKSLAPVRGFELQVLGDPPEFLDENGEPVDTSDELELSAGEWVASADIIAELDAVAELPEVAASGSYPAGSHMLFLVAPSNHTTVVDDSPLPPDSGPQHLTRNIGFRVDLFADIQDDRKYMVVSETGSGINPGTMLNDQQFSRGYYQEQVVVNIEPLHHALVAEKHAPLTVNGSSTFETSTNTSTSVEVSDGVPSLSVSVDSGTSASVTLPDFTVIDHSALDRSTWRFAMNATSKGAYTTWEDLLDEDDGVVSPPPLARTTLLPAFEAVYWADESFEGVAKTELHYGVVYQHVFFDPYFPWLPDHNTLTLGHTRNVAIDFGAVHVPRGGTLRLDERWGGSPIPDRWMTIVEGNKDTANWEVAPNEQIHMTGNSWGQGSDTLMRGTYLQAFDSYMRDGTLVADVLPEDNDSWGFVYGIQNSNDYYRAEVDKQRNFAQIVKFEGGYGTVIAQVPYQPTLHVWHQLKLVRSGNAHHLYLDGVLLVSALDQNSYGTGKVGLYTGGMESVYFGRVRVLRPNEADRNLAYGRPTTQSSTVYGGASSRAVDGGTDGDWAKGTVTHTAYTQQPWWRVDLGSAQTVDEVTVWNRTDCCSDRLANYDVEVLDESLNVVATRSHSGVSPTRRDFDMGGATGRYVRVRLQGTNQLSLAEVEVWGPEI